MLRPNPFSDTSVRVQCTRCGAAVYPASRSFLAMVGHILKLRCGQCDFEDWYLESEFFLGTEYEYSSIFQSKHAQTEMRK